MADQPALWEGIMAGDLATVAHLLEEHPDWLHARHQSGHGVVRLACDCGQRQLGLWLVERGAPVDAFDAAALGEAVRVQSFVEDQSNLLQQTSHDGWTLLHLAGFSGSGALCRWLLEQGSAVDAVSANALANQPLHAALAGGGDPESVDALLAAGADVSYAAGEGVTPLHLAASRGNRELVDRLMAAGAVPTKMADGKTPADLAADRGFAELAEHLST